MKNIVYILIIISIFGCQKEDGLKPNLKFENLYSIKDDTTDAVKHRVYEIYSQYGVPVYFNDTIGKIYVKDDIDGNPVYNYETIDMAWSFTDYERLRYRYEYLDSIDEQHQALDIIENYLNTSAKSLYPYNFFVVKSATAKNVRKEETIYKNGKYIIGTRSILMTGNWGLDNRDSITNRDSVIEALPTVMKKEMVKLKIQNFKNLLTAFNKVSNAIWYDNKFDQLDEKFYEVNKFKYVVDEREIELPNNAFTASCLSDDWYLKEYFAPEELEKCRAAYREKIGQFGFVSSSIRWKGTSTPNTTEEDLESYISEMLRWTKDEFYKLWGSSPLVIKKYNILYEILSGNLGIEL